MPRTSYKPEEIVAKLRQVDVLISQGQSTADAIRQPRVGTHKVASHGGRILIQDLRREMVDGSGVFLAERCAVRTA